MCVEEVDAIIHNILDMTSFVVQLRRMESSQPWGFRLRGGTDQGIALHVEHVRPTYFIQPRPVFIIDLLMSVSKNSFRQTTTLVHILSMISWVYSIDGEGAHPSPDD